MSIKAFSFSVGIYAAANIISRATVFLAAPVLTRILNPNEYGQWVLFLSAFSVLSVIFDLGISRAVPRFYVDSELAGKTSRFLAAAFGARILTVFCVGIVYFATIPFLLGPLTGGKLDFLIVGAALLVLCINESVMAFSLACFRAAERPIIYLIIRAGSAMAQVLLAWFVFTYFSPGFESIIWGYALGSLLGCVLALILMFKILGLRVNTLFSRDGHAMLRYGAPLVFHDLGTWIRNASDPLILVHFFSLTVVSIYSLSVMSGLAVGLIAFSIDLAYTPIFYKMLRRQPVLGRKLAAQIAEAYSLFMFVVVLIPVIFAEEIYSFVAPPQYSDAARYGSIIAISYFLFVQYTIFIKPAFFNKKTVVIPFITILPSAVGLLVNYLFVADLGVALFPATWFITFFVMALMAFAYSKSIDDMRFNWRLPAIICMGLLITLVGKNAIAGAGWSNLLEIKIVVFFLLCAIATYWIRRIYIKNKIYLFA